MAQLTPAQYNGLQWVRESGVGIAVVLVTASSQIQSLAWELKCAMGHKKFGLIPTSKY